jgi:hypothetical protein
VRTTSPRRSSTRSFFPSTSTPNWPNAAGGSGSNASAAIPGAPRRNGHPGFRPAPPKTAPALTRQTPNLRRDRTMGLTPTEARLQGRVDRREVVRQKHEALLAERDDAGLNETDKSHDRSVPHRGCRARRGDHRPDRRRRGEQAGRGSLVSCTGRRSTRRGSTITATGSSTGRWPSTRATSS